MMKIDDFRQMTKIHLKRKYSRMRRMLNLVHQEMLLMLMEVRLMMMVNLSMKINWELLDQDIAEIKFYELKKVEYFHMFKDFVVLGCGR